LSSMLSIIARRKVDPRTLEEAMRRELPPGTLKNNVIEFVRAMHPLRCDDHGRALTARWLEETALFPDSDRLYRLRFEGFDEAWVMPRTLGRIAVCSLKKSLTARNSPKA
jgi:hypothetical protein